MHNVLNPLHVAKNGEMALHMLRGTGGFPKLDPRPQIVLLDINMPRMNGLEFLREVREDPGLSPMSVFVLTTSKEDSDRFEAYKLNVAGYIIKPVSFSQFLEKVRVLNSYWKLCEMPPETNDTDG